MLSLLCALQEWSFHLETTDTNAPYSIDTGQSGPRFLQGERLPKRFLFPWPSVRACFHLKTFVSSSHAANKCRWISAPLYVAARVNMFIYTRHCYRALTCLCPLARLYYGVAERQVLGI